MGRFEYFWEIEIEVLKDFALRPISLSDLRF